MMGLKASIESLTEKMQTLEATVEDIRSAITGTVHDDKGILERLSALEHSYRAHVENHGMSKARKIKIVTALFVGAATGAGTVFITESYKNVITYIHKLF